MIKRYQKNRKHKKIIGIIDEDTSTHSKNLPFEKGFKEIRNFNREEIKLLHKSKNAIDAILIVLCPRLEEWMLRAAEEANHDPKKYNLHNSANKLHAEGRNPRNFYKLKRLLEGILGNSPRLDKLIELLNCKMPNS